MIIYKATNIINKKCYIGQTVKTLEKRKADHLNTARRGGGFRFHNALRRYGETNFTWEVIDTTTSIEALNQRESYWINFYDSYNKGYNATLGGENNPMNSDIVIKKHKNVVKSNDFRKKVSYTMKKHRKNNPFTQETRDKISCKLKGNKHGLGKTRPKDAIEKTSKALAKNIYCVDINNKVIMEFEYVKDGAKWWHENGMEHYAHYRSIMRIIKKSHEDNRYINNIKWIYK